jgi:hypothetical protein
MSVVSIRDHGVKSCALLIVHSDCDSIPAKDAAVVLPL